MAIALVSHNFGQNSAASTTVTTGSLGSGNLTSSQLVCGWVVFTNDHAGADPTITDNSSPSNTYTLVDKAITTFGGTWLRSFWLAAPAGTPNATPTITATWSLSVTFNAIFVEVISGTDLTAAALDQHNIATGSSTTPTSTSVTPGTNGEWCFGGLAQDAGVSTVTNNGSNFTVRDQDTIPIGADEDFLQTSAGAISAQFSTSPTSSTWACGIMTFKPSGGGGGGGVKCSGKLLSLGVGCWAANKIIQNPLVTRRDLFVPRSLKGVN